MKKLPREGKPSRFSSWLRQHGIWWAFDLFYGIESRIPICCVLYFVSGVLRYGQKCFRAEDGSLCRISKHPGRIKHPSYGWIPCKWHLAISPTEHSE